MTQNSIALAIYNRGTSLVQDSRTVQFEAGINTVHFADVAAGIDTTSVQFVSLSDPDGTVMLEQSYIYDLIDNSALLERYLDQTIEVVLEEGKTYSGKLLNGRKQDVILQTSDGKVVSFNVAKISELHFPAMPGGLTTRPTLRWLVNASQGGEQDIQLTYLTDGLNWSANYIMVLSRDEKSFDLTGWVKLDNQSGTAYTDAKVKLIAGEINRVPMPSARSNDMHFARSESILPPRDYSQYKLYEIARPVTLAGSETKQIEFLNTSNVQVSQVFTSMASMIPSMLENGKPYRDPYQWVASSGAIDFSLEFTTGAESGLDAELPPGVVRVYQPDVDGAALLIGENNIPQAAKGEKVSIRLGKAFDLGTKRERLDFHWVAPNILEETHQIRLSNRKNTETIEILVPERLFRWLNWEITSASMAYTKTKADQIEFRPQVAPGEEVVITYTVRYDFPPEAADK